MQNYKIMIDTRIAKFSIHSLKLDQVQNQSLSLKKGAFRKLRTTIKRPISNAESPQKQTQIKSNLLNKELPLNSVQPNIHGRGKTIQVRNVSLNLPQIRQSPMRTQAEDYDQKNVEIISYSSGKLNHHRDRIVHNVKERYYKKIEVMKEIKVPTVTHQFFSLPQTSNSSVTTFVKDVNYASEAQRTSLISKKSLANITLQKFQILREKQQVEIPKQLQAKKFHTRYGYNTIATESKNSIRFKFDSMLAKQRKSIKEIPQKSDRKQLQGWQSDSQFGFQQQLMFD